MSKGYATAMALFEAGKQVGLATVAKEKPQRTDKPSEKKEKVPSFEAMWMEEKKRRDQFDAFMKMMMKQNAEDPKKDDKKDKKISDIDKVLLLMALSPFIGAAALAFMKAVLQL